MTDENEASGVIILPDLLQCNNSAAENGTDWPPFNPHTPIYLRNQEFIYTTVGEPHSTYTTPSLILIKFGLTLELQTIGIGYVFAFATLAII